VLVVGEGDDPTALLETLSAMAQEWKDEWELVLVSRWGSACEAAAVHLEGDVQVLTNREPVDHEVALNQAALSARGRDLIIPTPSGAVRVSRTAFLSG
jgi:hypothetical protein